ncbi:hypothetical protein WN48_11347 [Eufriesea mexicana]|uniref:RIIa domain-containing protein n=1 Tax=Eufriesea mexicana TaxID=516756 RepID=A0A310SS16_9HYME|nr:hypothetical protein WN48_11347 [Eufriesea mexicana]
MTEAEYIIAPRIPQGLAPAVEGLAREILRHKPRDIYTFAARHFAELVELRDKECTAGIAPKILNCKSFNERDYVVNWIEFNVNNVAVSKNGDLCTRRDSYGNLTDELMVLKEPVSSTIMQKATLSKKKKETTNKSGWSINRTVKVLKKHKYASSVEKGEKLSNIEINGKEIQEIISGYPEYRSPRFLRSLTCGQFLRSSSVGSIFAKNIKSREDRESRKTMYSFALDKYAIGNLKQKCDKGYNINANNLMRQKSADQIKNISTCVKDTNVDVGIIGRRRSRSLVNNGNETKSNPEERTARQYTTDGEIPRDLRDHWKTTLEDQHKQQEKLQEKLQKKFSVTKENSEKLSLRLGKMNEEYSKGNEVEEILQQSDTPDDAVNKGAIDIDGTISVILPSVVTRQPSGKCIKNNVYGSNIESNAGNLILPPISSDGLKTIKKESNLTLPSLSNDMDAWLVNEQTMYHHDNEDSSSNHYYNDQADKEFELTRNIETTNCDYGMKVIHTECKGEDLKGSKPEENAILICTGNIIVQDGTRHIDKTEASKEIGQYSKSQEADTEEMFFRDSLNVTPDSIDLSQRPDSLEHVENEKAAGQEQCRPNELERKLIEIETVEKSIENTLASSRTIPPCVNGSEGSCLIRSSSNQENRESDKLDCVHRNDIILVGETNRQICPRDDGWVKKDDKDIEDNRVIDSAESEIGNRRSFSDNSEIFISTGINSTLNVTNIEETHNEFKRGDAHSCYVLTEGSPCEIPEAVTTVIIPDKIFQIDDDVCKVEEILMNNAILRLKEPILSGYLETQKELGKGYWHEANPFGEYIRQNVIDYSTSIDAHFLCDIRNTAERMTACQDLGNIKEEEENESDKLSSNVTQHNIRQVIGYSVNMPESMKYEKSIEYEANLAGFSNRKQNNIDLNDSLTEEHIKGKEDWSEDLAVSTTKSSRERKEQGREMFNDHSGNFSLSFEEAGPQVPELNLDSLPDTTVSSIEKSDSDRKDHGIQPEKENNNTSFLESENTSLSSSDYLPVEEKLIDETFSSKNELLREEFFIESKDQVTKIRNESDKYIATSKLENDDSIKTFSYDKKKEEDSHCMEEEIAKELIENLILDVSAVEGNTCKYQRNNMINQTDDVAIKFRSSVQLSTPETPIEEYDEIEIELLENRQEEEDVESVSSRHTGEFHDSLPLPFIGIPRSVSSMNIYDLKAVHKTTDGRVALPDNILRNRRYTRVPSTIFSDYKSSRTTVPRGIGFLKNFNLLVNKSDWTELPLNTSPCIIHIEQMFKEVHTTNKAVIPHAKTNSDFDTDDLREPLALDNSQEPIIIEEISNLDNGNEQMLPFYKADANFTKERSSFSSDDHYDFDCAKDKRKNKLDASSSEANEADRFVENDNSYIDRCVDSANPSDNPLKIVKDKVCDKGKNEK